MSAEGVVESPAPAPRPRATYWLTRFVLLRVLGVVYLTAFLVAAHQAVPLIGHHGITPLDLNLERLEKVYAQEMTKDFEERDWTWSFHKRYLDGIRGTFGEWLAVPLHAMDRFFHGYQNHVAPETSVRLSHPSLFWWWHSDGFIQVVAWTGVVLSALVVCGFANSLLLLVLWGLYMSFASVGLLWFSYGWDMQICETAFIAVFLAPLWDARPFARTEPAIVPLWLFRWLIFRIMVGAFLIKWRGDPCWSDLTALYYHYETQPVPNPLSRYLHFAPQWFQKLGVLWNHFVEIVVPWFAFWPKLARNIAGILMILFQVILIFSGNLSFLNWLTIVPCIACIDDSVWRRVLPKFIVRASERAEAEKKPTTRLRAITCWIFAGLVALLSVPVVVNLFSKNQDMNNSYGPLYLVNTYGAFGSVGKERYEVVIEGTRDPVPLESSDWREYEFKVKPGDVKRRPAVISPYHYRLDWQIWFCPIPMVDYKIETMPTINHYPWTVSFAWKLLHNDPTVLGLLAKNPFPDQPPRVVRGVLYRYKFAPVGNKDGAWWTRERVGIWMPEISILNSQIENSLRIIGLLNEDGK